MRARNERNDDIGEASFLKLPLPKNLREPQYREQTSCKTNKNELAKKPSKASTAVSELNTTMVDLECACF